MNIGNMTRILTEDELLSRIRLMRDMEPLYDSDIREDCVTAERYLRERIRAIYTELLTGLPEDDLPLSDISGEVKIEKIAPGIREMTVPATTLRLVELKMKGDERSAILAEPGSDEARRQESPYSRSGASAPTAVIRGGGKLTIYGGEGEESDTVERVMAVTMPEKGEYRLTPAMEQELMKRLRNDEN